MLPGRALWGPLSEKKKPSEHKWLKQCSSICQGNGGPECQSPSHPARENSGGAQGVQPPSTQPPRSRLIRANGQAEPPTRNRVPTKRGAKNVSCIWSAALLRKAESGLQEPGRDPGLVAEGTPGLSSPAGGGSPWSHGVAGLW
uniref:Uncharacterized protein n=1 Tax=Macaca fascicularis TaxID=9541 RepID=Q9GM26_MACFA|nr:hypothetical protein [Macaca fascicularis]